MLTSIFTFRELIDPQDLLAYFRLRHQVYCAEGYLDPGQIPIDLDAFDARSRFVGAFWKGELVAGARMILPQGQPHVQTLQRLAARGQIPEIETSQEICNFQELFDLDGIFEYCSQRKRTLVEFGRAVVKPELRSTGLGLKMVYALYGLALSHGVEFGFAAVPPKLRGFYEKSGCRMMDFKGIARKNGISSDLMALVIDLQRLGGVFRAAYRAHKHMARYGCWQVCGERHCLEEHQHLPQTDWKPVLPVSLLPPVQTHGWESALHRLPMLREDLEIQDQTLADGLNSASARHPSLEAMRKFLDHLVELGVQSLALKIYDPWVEPLLREVAQRQLPLGVSLNASTRISDIHNLLRLAHRTGVRVEANLSAWGGPGRVEEAVSLTASGGLAVALTVEDACRTAPRILEPLCMAALQGGATAICLSDSAGFATPYGTGRLIGYVQDLTRRIPTPVQLEWRGRNDRGLAVANSLAAIQAGVGRIHATAVGAGERAGCASMENILLQLHRLSGRPLKLSALKSYLDWAERHLELPTSAEIVEMLKSGVEHASSVA